MPFFPQAGGQQSPQPNRPSFLHDIRAFLKEWIRLNGFDMIMMLVIGGVSLGIYRAPIYTTRTFPITFTNSGDIIYPEWAYPYRGWILPSWLSGLVSILGPILVYFTAQIRIKSAWDASNAIMGTVWSVAIASLFQVTIKQFIGGFRPYFLDVCQPDISLAKTYNKTGLNAVGFQQVMYTTEICTQTNKALLKDAITGFPSGHATAGFAGFVFLFLWMNAKLKVWADHKPALWKLTLTMVPMLASVLIAGSLTIDAAHNWYDIVGGSIIGTFTAIASYRSTYAAVLDWRFNHLPLQEKKPFAYGSEDRYALVTQTFTQSVGWGNRRDSSIELREGMSSDVHERHPGGVGMEHTGETAGESGRPKRRAVDGVVEGGV